jgi:hypothetical protein
MQLSSIRFRVLGSLLLPLSMLAGVAALPTGVSAAAPQHVNFSGTQSNVDVCGIPVTVTYSGVDNFWPVFDSSGNRIAFKDTHQEQDTFTAANGQSITLHVAAQETQTTTTNPDGIVTVVSTYKGLPEQIETPNGPVLTQDAGLITFVDTFDAAGNFLSDTISVENGPHPEADSGGALFCQVVTAVLT